MVFFGGVLFAKTIFRVQYNVSYNEIKFIFIWIHESKPGISCRTPFESQVTDRFLDSLRWFERSSRPLTRFLNTNNTRAKLCSNAIAWSRPTKLETSRTVILPHRYVSILSISLPFPVSGKRATEEEGKRCKNETGWLHRSW